MHLMTPGQRRTARDNLGAGGPAAIELVLTTARRLGNGTLTVRQGDVHRHHEIAAVIRRLLTTEQQAEALRRVLAEAVATAGDLPDDGLTTDDLLGLLAAAGLDLAQDIAEALREAHALAGVGGRFRLLTDLEGMSR